MSVSSKKRRRARRGGLLGHLGRAFAALQPPAILDPATKAGAFARVALGRHGVVLVGLEVSEEHFAALATVFPNVRRERLVSPLDIVAAELPPLPPIDLLGDLVIAPPARHGETVFRASLAAFKAGRRWW